MDDEAELQKVMKPGIYWIRRLQNEWTIVQVSYECSLDNSGRLEVQCLGTDETYFLTDDAGNLVDELNSEWQEVKPPNEAELQKEK